MVPHEGLNGGEVRLFINNTDLQITIHTEEGCLEHVQHQAQVSDPSAPPPLFSPRRTPSSHSAKLVTTGQTRSKACIKNSAGQVTTLTSAGGNVTRSVAQIDHPLQSHCAERTALRSELPWPQFVKQRSFTPLYQVGRPRCQNAWKEFPCCLVWGSPLQSHQLLLPLAVFELGKFWNCRLYLSVFRMNYQVSLGV